MKLNQDIAVSTDQVLLVPYDGHHVVTYHRWMEDPAIQEATASERLTLEEEYENQQSWRESHDKLTFIICHATQAERAVYAGQCDTPNRMIGDINLFLYPLDGDDDGDDERQEPVGYAGEIDVMVAGYGHRGRGIGKAAVSSFLHYIQRNLSGLLAEHGHDGAGGLRLFMAKIKADNAASIALFRGLGFRQEGEANYFGEIKMVLDASAAHMAAPAGYRELAYRRRLDTAAAAQATGSR